MNKTILLFGVSENQQEKIKSFCSSFAVQVKAVANEDFDRPISSLVGLPKTKNTFMRRSQGTTRTLDGTPQKAYHLTGFPEPMLVFCNLEQEDLDLYLKEYSSAGIEKISLKAILTPHNIFWTPKQLFEELFEELSEEHRSMMSKK